jgi:hypothetical protein
MSFTAAERAQRGGYGVLFARVALGSPRVVLGACAALSLASVLAIGGAIASDPLEYDFRNLQADRSAASRVSWANDRINETIEETRTGGALAILAASADDVPDLRAQLEQHGREHPGVMGTVRTIDDFMPADQTTKLALLAELRSLVLEVRPHVSAELQQQIDENLPPADLQRVTREDLPESIARPFIERDGTRGRLLFVEHAAGHDTWDGRYMIAWAAAVRSAHPAGGRSPAVGGGAAVFADLLEAIFSDAPRTILASFVLTVLLLLFTFRRQRERLLALGSMLAGVLWMIGMLAASGTKLNFLNIVGLPITFGIGLEYGVNFVKRFLEEKQLRGGDGVQAARAALEGAGGAVILCSLTTLIGYVSLYASANRALNSFGLAMSIGEVTCLGASVIALPAFLHLLESRARRPAVEETTTHE